MLFARSTPVGRVQQRISRRLQCTPRGPPALLDQPMAAFNLPARPSALHADSLDLDVASFNSIAIANVADWTGAGVSKPMSRP